MLERKIDLTLSTNVRRKPIRYLAHLDHLGKNADCDTQQSPVK
jgi:hypothetical protein